MLTEHGFLKDESDGNWTEVDASAFILSGWKLPIVLVYGAGQAPHTRYEVNPSTGEKKCTFLPSEEEHDLTSLINYQAEQLHDEAWEAFKCHNEKGIKLPPFRW